MEKGRLIVITLIFAVVAFFAILAIFPMILTGSDEVNATTNVTQYYGMAEIGRFAPTLIWVLLFIGVLGSLGWIFRDNIKRKFFGD